jgi:hypothetical protein
MTDAFSVLSILNESLTGSRFYLFSAKPDEFVFHSIRDVPVEFALVWTEDDYKSYQHYLSEFAPDDNYNYIYRINKKLNLFRADSTHIQSLVREGIIEPIKVSSMRAKDFIDTYCKENMEAFRKIYDGFVDRDVAVFRDVIEECAELIDGNAVRFPGNPEEEQEVKTEDNYWGEVVLPALKHYTEKPERSLPKEVVDWLKENVDKPYNTRTFYRGFAIDFGGNWYGREEIPHDLSLDTCNKTLETFTGLEHILNIRVNAPVTVRRKKESSWSLYPEVAEGFARGWGGAHLNFLLKAEIPADHIIIDLSTLPEDVKKELKYWTQNEVIVEDIPIKARIVKVWPNDAYKEWLRKSGYRILPKVGLVAGVDESYSRPALF